MEIKFITNYLNSLWPLSLKKNTLYVIGLREGCQPGLVWLDSDGKLTSVGLGIELPEKINIRLTKKNLKSIMMKKPAVAKMAKALRLERR